MSFNPNQMNNISNTELMLLVMSNIIGIGILSMPNMIANKTLFSDGWIVLLLAGFISAILGWICTKLSAQFPKHSFFEYTSTLISKPFAFILTLMAVCMYLCMAAYEARGISIVVNIYLMDDTPLEIIALVFLLVITYGLSISRIALLRLNIWFLLIVLVVLLFLITLNINIMKLENLFPIFVTAPNNYLKSMENTAFTFSGFEIVLFYTSLIQKPKQAPKYVFKGILLLTLIYILIYLVCVLVLSQPVIKDLTYPVIELGKGIQIRGGFLERFDALFFTTWVIKLFTTTIMYIDISLIAFCSIFKTISKKTFIFIFMPVIYCIAFIPSSMSELSKFGYKLSLFNLGYLILVPACLLILTFIKRYLNNASKESSHP
ncbi:GerAB/ArcD/ProY family transporter [Bacillus cereus]|uniref:GerAB/ArcD/ProY family transporter n=1 Tax=Bacillus cereus TaxID=1396 RepID=UPI000C294184|nr:endospore germination permease [Bacillus cereus]